MHKKNVFLIFALLFTNYLFPMDIDDLEFGESTTFEVLSWNLEWFPKNGQTTINYVKDIIEALDVDIIALQEITEYDEFNQLINSLDGWDGCYVNSEYSDLAYIYKTDTLEINSIYQIYTTEQYWRPFPRAPYVIDLDFAGQNYIIINNHLKAFGDGDINPNDPWDEETRRYDACNLLKAYIDNHLSNKNVIVVGDFNDELTDNQSDNVFQNILNDTENYLFADYGIATGTSSNWSYPSYPSHIDHILITNDLFDEFEDANSTIQTIKIDTYLPGGFNEYDNNISDHRPVGLRLVTENAIAPILSKFKLNNYPNPFNPTTTIEFSLTEKSKVQVSLYNVLGKKIKAFSAKEYTPGSHFVSWTGKDNLGQKVPSGLYFIKLEVNGKISEIRKCVLLK